MFAPWRSQNPLRIHGSLITGKSFIDNGLGFSHVNSTLTALDIPSITRKTYKIREHEVGKIAEGVGKDSYKEILDQECILVKKNGAVVGGDGLLPLSVSFDMGWSKRGRAHNSLTGHGAVMAGSLTGKPLDYATRNKLCRTCSSVKRDDMVVVLAPMTAD